MTRSRDSLVEQLADLPLRLPTPEAWPTLAASNLPVFMADHAVCEQQAALSALNLVAHYPEDAELVDRMCALAAEEVVHLRRVASLLHRRGLRPARRRPNPYVQRLRARIGSREPERKIDHLLVGALIEARSCERFTRLLDVIHPHDSELADLLCELGPAEKRHWELFHRLAARELDASMLDRRWGDWLDYEASLVRESGKLPTVHG